MLPAGTTLGPFKVDRHGLLSPASAAHMPSFAVRWRGRLIQARITSDGETLGALQLSTHIGRVPSTAGRATLTGHRQAAIDLMRAMPGAIPPWLQVRLAADHTIVMQTRTALPMPVSAVALVVEMSMFLMSLAPYLDILDDEGMGLANPGDRPNSGARRDS